MRSLHVFLTFLVFLASCCIGYTIALKKPIWGDEQYSEQTHIGASSYKDILIGNQPDGEKAPIYFCLQKAIEQAIGYHFPNVNPKSVYYDVRSQVICRLSSIIYMSLAISLIFYYFTSTTAIWAGAAALFITLSSFMVWGYWAEDRIYAFWFLLTAIQSLLLLHVSENPKSNVINALMATNILIALTTPLSVTQIGVVVVWMFFIGRRKITDYLAVGLVPILICLFYYHHSQEHYEFVFTFPVWKNITGNIPIERLALLFLGGICLWKLQSKSPQERRKDFNYLLYAVFIFMAALGVLLLFKLKAAVPGTPPGHKAGHLWVIEAEARYLIFLAPTGIVSLSFMFLRWIKLSRAMVSRFILVLLLLVMTMPRIWKYTHFSYASGGAKDPVSSFAPPSHTGSPSP